jgi:hypothetical protein
VKASDEQRVDNCKVPIELRGAKSRRPTTTPSASTSKSSSLHWPDERLPMRV